LDINGTQVSIASLTGAGSVLSNSSSSTGTIVSMLLRDRNLHGTMANGSTSRTLSVTKSGVGTFILAGQGRYNGITNVNQGTFAMSGLTSAWRSTRNGLRRLRHPPAAALRFQDTPNIVGGISGAGSTYWRQFEHHRHRQYVRQNLLNIGIGTR